MDYSSSTRFVYIYRPGEKTNTLLSIVLSRIVSIKNDPLHPRQKARKLRLSLDRGSENCNKWMLGQSAYLCSGMLICFNCMRL
jgi:hypothetical protein